MNITSLDQLAGTHFVKVRKLERSEFLAKVNYAHNPAFRLRFAYLNYAIGEDGVHSASMITEEDLREGKACVKIVNPSEVKDVKFSYSS